MPEDEWGILRDRITDFAADKDGGRLARCMHCNSRVFIQTRVSGEKRLPYFVHYSGGDPACPWFQGKTISPDAARAAQYGGAQESNAHRSLCEEIDRLLSLDTRYRKSTVGLYHSPAESKHGRFPDVYVELEGLRPFVIEVQISHTFQTEVSGRSLYYHREGVGLVWVLYGIDPQHDALPQSFRDVVRRHRGNAFVLDLDAVRESQRQRTLVLKCYCKNALDEFDPPVFVTLDQLQIPKKGLPFLEDRITSALRERIDARRKPWFSALNSLLKAQSESATHSEEIDEAFRELRKSVPQFSNYYSGDEERFEILRLISAVFSVISTANGKERNYASRHPNIRAMLNTFLNMDSGFPIYALLIERLLRLTALHQLLGGTVGEHIERAKGRMDGNLCLDFEPEWDIMRHLVPEVFDPVTRDELIYLDALPEWACSPHKVVELDG